MSNKLIYTPLLLFIFFSCANYKIHYGEGEQKFLDGSGPPDSELEHRLYFTANLNQALAVDTLTPLLSVLTKELKTAPDESTVLFLGNNIPAEVTSGSQHSTNADEFAQNQTTRFLDQLKSFHGNIYFVPGYQEWQAEDGVGAVKKQEQYIQDYLDKGEVFIPDDACSGPEVEDLSENVVVMGLDSQWWLENWNKEPAMNGDCELKSRYAFMRIFEDEIKGHKDKTVIVAMHHSFYSNGPFGGVYPIEDHIFPIKKGGKNVWIPLPLIGSVVPLYHSMAGAKQDIAYPPFRSFKKQMLRVTKKYKNVIYVSGHDHILQYYGNKRKGRHFIVSGAGSQPAKAKAGNDAQFVYGHEGFAQLDCYKDGSVWLRFWVPTVDGQDKKLVYQQKLHDSRKRDKEDYRFENRAELNSTGDSIRTSIYAGKTKNSKAYEFLLGKHYRDLYFMEMDFPVLKVDTAFGGVEPVKQGGGFQTRSLRFTNEAERDYAFRSLEKNAKRTLPYPLNKTFAVDILKDQFTAAHPMAALTVPDMARAINVYHTNPEIYYVPRQAGLKQYSKSFGGQLFLVEGRPDDNWEDKASFGNSTNIIGTDDVYEEMRSNWKNRVDQNWTIRTRLFDFILGDWDRHFDQWRWAYIADTISNKNIYRPIPRDRDQVYSRYDGFLASLIRLGPPFFKQLQNFGEKIPEIKWMGQNGKWFDRMFLNELEWKDWEREALYIQENLTDEIIENAIKNNLPDTVFQWEGSGEEIIAGLKAHRDDLLEYTRDYYKILAKEVTVIGTEDNDYIEVIRSEDETVVMFYDQSSEGEKDELFYKRSFKQSETKEIVLYGLGGDDIFEIKGEGRSGILLRLVGGQGDDKVKDRSKVNGWSRKTKVYDGLKGIKIDGSSETKDKRTRRLRVNQYGFYEFRNDFGIPLPAFGYNPDDGLFLGFGYVYTKHGFKKFPYAQRHKITGRISTNRAAYDFRYEAEYNSVFTNWLGFFHEGFFQAPQYTVNYFGSGNESTTAFDTESFYRVRTQQFKYFPGLRARFRNGGSLTLGVSGEAIRVENTKDRFVSDTTSGVAPELFDFQYFAGAKLRYQFSNTNKTFYPSMGVKIRLESGLNYQLNAAKNSIPFASARITLYHALDKNQTWVLATRLGAKIVKGDFPFYQSAILSGNEHIRGYRAERFYGNAYFYHNIELRGKLMTVAKNKIPSSFGFSAGVDYGRVWLKDEDSDKWHRSVGGGLWISPLNFFIIQASLYKSTEDQQFSLGTQFFF